MNNEISRVKVAGVAVGGTPLTFLVTAGDLNPYVQNVVTVVLSLAVLMHAISTLVSAVNKTK
jgi:hypothetical protein